MVYTNWNGQIKEWDENTGVLCFYGTPKRIDGSTKYRWCWGDGSIAGLCTVEGGKYDFPRKCQSIDEAKIRLEQIKKSHDGWDFSNIRIVRAPCVWDAPIAHVQLA